jgi:hypothetical protein
MYFRCPDCHVVGHLRIDSKTYATEREWLKALHPEHDPNTILKLRCFTCTPKPDRGGVVNAEK